MCVLCDEEEDPFVEDQAKEERSLVPGYMYGYDYEGSEPVTKNTTPPRSSRTF